MFLRIQVCASIQKNLHDFGATVSHEHRGGSSIVILRIHVRTCIQENSHYFRVTLMNRSHQGGHPIFIRINICAGIQKGPHVIGTRELRGSWFTRHYCQHQSGCSLVSPRIYICPCVQKGLYDFSVMSSCSGHQGGSSTVIFRLQVCASIQKNLHDFGATVSHEHQGCKPRVILRIHVRTCI